MNFNAFFEQVPISLWEKDLSGLKKIVEDLKEKVNVDDMPLYLDTHGEFLQEAMTHILIKNVNGRTLKLCAANNKNELNDNLDKLFTPETLVTFKKEIVSMAKGEEYFYDYSFIKALDGTVKPIYISVHYPINDDFKSVLVSMVDLSESYEHDKKIANMSETYQDLIELTGTAFVLLNKNFEIIDSSEKFRDIVGIHGMVALIGKNLRRWISPDLVENYDITISKINKGESPQNIELLLDGKSANDLDRTVWIDLTMSKMEDSTIFCLVKDITEKKTIEMQEFISEQRKRDKIKQSINKIRDQIKVQGESRCSV